MLATVRARPLVTTTLALIAALVLTVLTAPPASANREGGFLTCNAGEYVWLQSEGIGDLHHRWGGANPEDPVVEEVYDYVPEVQVITTPTWRQSTVWSAWYADPGWWGHAEAISHTAYCSPDGTR